MNDRFTGYGGGDGLRAEAGPGTAAAPRAAAALLACALLAAAWLHGLPAFAGQEPATTIGLKPLSLDFHALIQSLVYFKNDSDFDRTEPFYNASGQTVGLAGTIFTPRFLLQAGEQLQIYYEAELGINLWSQNNPDEQDPAADDIFLLKHREIWAKVYLGSPYFGAKVGYQRFIDPTGLFYNHWIGVASLFIEAGRSAVTLSFGQVPDSTYEGISFDANNFKQDTFLAALRYDYTGDWGLDASAGVFGLIDTSIVGKPDTVIMPCLRLTYARGSFTGLLSAAFQGGVEENVTVDGGRALNLAWAVEAGARYEVKGVQLDVGALLLSADDDYENNDINGAFYYSGKNRSLTRLMTENEVRDVYDNFDEKMAAQRGAFYLMRTGLALFDIGVRRRFADFIEPGLVLSTFVVLNPDNALGHAWGGFEGDVILNLHFTESIALLASGAVLVPGRALSAGVNRIDLGATDPILMLMAVLDVRL